MTISSSFVHLCRSDGGIMVFKFTELFRDQSSKMVKQHNKKLANNLTIRQKWSETFSE